MNRTQRQCQQQVHELNTTLETRTSEYSHLVLSQRICLNNLSALNNNLTMLENNITTLSSELSEQKRTQSDLRHQLNQHEMTYRIIKENKAQICQYLTSKRVPACPQGWIEHEGRCYFLSILEESYDGSREHCSNFDARLLEIGSKQEEEFVSTSIGEVYQTYWIGKCRYGNVDSNLLRKYNSRSSCSKCNAYRGYNPCKSKRRFICEKSAHLYPDIPAEIRGLCQHPEGKT
ncbi:CD209 antigen-like protein C [Hypanus sabinus]|uniref:CD209 antigen-like protein C n=1 Tax=Hypanus sabinus TaxID=79690 RepID=UPI0028C3CC0B|nr:CD209 antigen-like protein C [Hypanus sabinus]